MSQATPQTIDFGFQRVDVLDKTAKVQDIFHRVAGNYDVMNTVMSLGTHHVWKDILERDIPVVDGGIYVDVAGGTGDVAFNIHKKLASKGAKAEIFVCDMNTSMMEEGRKKEHESDVGWLCGDAAALALPDRSVDVYTISFGLRNVTHYEGALREAHRALKFGGVYYCLEFSRVDLPLLKGVYDFHSFKLIPWLGALIADDKDAYVYLVESIRQFPSQHKMVGLLEKVGFMSVEAIPLFGGIATLYKAWKS